MVESATTPTPTNEMTKPRRFRSFSLRSLFVLVTLAAAAAGWLAYQQEWIRQRTVAATKYEAVVKLFSQRVEPGIYSHQPPYPTRTHNVTFSWVCKPRTPWPLRWLGAQGYASLTTGDATPPNEIARLHALFPEAEIHVYPEAVFRRASE